MGQRLPDELATLDGLGENSVYSAYTCQETELRICLADQDFAREDTEVLNRREVQLEEREVLLERRCSAPRTRLELTPS